jgi:preprotein translocase subunit SecE
VMVLIMVVITAVFFAVVDVGLSTAVGWILKVGGGGTSS